MSKYLITISTASRRGRTKLHTFGKLIEAEHLQWFAETHASRGQLKQRQVAGSPLPSPWPPPPRRSLGTAFYDEVGDGMIELGAGVDVAAATLTLILDALRSDERHEVDLGDLKTVISQLGSRIAQLDRLSDDQRRVAVPGLYKQILTRCTTL